MSAISARPRKRSLTLHGHRTSVSLEDAFWHELRRIAEGQGLAVNALAERIDEARTAPGRDDPDGATGSKAGGGEAGLASAIRVWVLEHALAGR